MMMHVGGFPLCILSCDQTHCGDCFQETPSSSERVPQQVSPGKKVVKDSSGSFAAGRCLTSTFGLAFILIDVCMVSLKTRHEYRWD